METGPIDSNNSHSLNVALVTSGYFTAGGVQTVARWLKDQLIDEGHSVMVFDIAASSRSEASRRIYQPATWFRFPAIARSALDESVTTVGTTLAELEILRYTPQRRLTRELDGFDIVQVVCGGPALALKTIGTRTPVVVQMATLAKWERSARLKELPMPRRLFETLMTQLVSLVEPIGLRRANATLVENAQVQEALVRKGIPNVQLAPPGVDVDRFAPTETKHHLTGAIVCLGRLGDTRKGLDRLIRAYSAAKTIDKSIPNLIICGRGSLSEAAKTELLISPWAKSIEILTDLSEEDVLGVLGSGSIFVQASHEEGLGVALLEGMACGLPAIATETAGTNETVISGTNGILIPQSDFDGNSLALAIQTIQSDYARFSTSARRFSADNFSNEVSFRRFIDCYKSI